MLFLFLESNRLHFFATTMTVSGYGYLLFDNTQSDGKCGLSIKVARNILLVLHDLTL